MEKRRIILLCAINALLLALTVACLLRIHSDSTVLQSQRAAVYWAGGSEERFTQVSCYFPVNNLSDTDTINTFRNTIDGKLNEAGVEAKEDRSYWTDCYSAQDTLTVEGDRNSSEATAIGVGGDFFLFHPYELLSGSYLSEDDLMDDRVVLDYELAWKLFGGTSLEGMTVSIGGKPYYVAGVVYRETDGFSEKAYSDDPVIFMSYSALYGINGNIGIDCYELVMPDPVSNFASNFVQESFEDDKGVAVENSTRYEFSKIYDLFKNFGSRSIADNGVAYPYWENAARVSEVHIARLYVFILLLMIFPFICLIVLAVRLIKRLSARIKRTKHELYEAWDDRYAREAAWKEKRARRKAAKSSDKQGKKKLHKQKPEKQEKKTLRKRKPEKIAEAKAAGKEQDKSENEAVPDTETIFREIMEEAEDWDSKV